jgi:hypothetical protein
MREASRTVEISTSGGNTVRAVSITVSDIGRVGSTHAGSLVLGYPCFVTLLCLKWFALRQYDYCFVPVL